MSKETIVPSMIPPTAGELSWRTARNCDGGNCIRVATSKDKVTIGDSKNPDGPMLSYSRAEWVAFIDGIKREDIGDLLKRA